MSRIALFVENKRTWFRDGCVVWRQCGFIQWRGIRWYTICSQTCWFHV